MKRNIFFCGLILGLLFIAIQSNAQCWKYEKDQVFEGNTQSWVNAPALDPKWAKLKDNKKDEQIQEFNQVILDGRKGDFGGGLDFKVINVEEKEGIGYLTLQTVDGSYTSASLCIEDTLNLVRNPGLIYSVVNGDTLGFAFQGYQKIPNKLKIGDRIPEYRDWVMTFPKEIKTEMKETVLDHSYSDYMNTGPLWGYADGGIVYASNLRLKVQVDVYKQISHEVTISHFMESSTVHYKNAMVTGEEQIQVGSKSLLAYVIESESWTKTKLEQDYDSENAAIAAKAQIQYDRFKEKIEKKQRRSGMTNEEGYLVNFRTEWFVPGYGVLRMITYDQWGAIMAQTETRFY